MRPWMTLNGAIYRPKRASFAAHEGNVNENRPALSVIDMLHLRTHRLSHQINSAPRGFSSTARLSCLFGKLASF